MRDLATCVPDREQANLGLNFAAKDSGSEVPDPRPGAGPGPGIRLPVDIDQQMVQEPVTDAEITAREGNANGAYQDS